MNILGLRLIADIMGWDEGGTATEEYAWLRLMAATKYDGYSDFRAGSRFIENLATWLKQFEAADRQTAYEFVRHRLVYVSAAEMQRTIEAFVPETVTPHLRRLAAQAADIAPHEVWGSSDGAVAFKRILRRCLFIGLSDGSRIDILRRANATKLTTEQIAPMMNIGIEKWQDLGKELKEAEKDEDARFEHVYLIDDFTASGTTFIRKVDGRWKGKLTKFNDLVEEARREMREHFPLASGYALHVHHYLSTYKARQALDARVEDARTNWTDRSFGDISITQGVLLPEALPLDAVLDKNVIDMCGKYYDDQLYQRLKKHCDEAGQTNMKLGYADCALPIVLEHNTPNNSIPLLWAETQGTLGHRMVPLFRRRDRHG